jgi:hypothetical protein
MPTAITRPTREVGFRVPGVIEGNIQPWHQWQGRISIKNTLHAYFTGADAKKRSTELLKGTTRTALGVGVVGLGATVAAGKLIKGTEEAVYGGRPPESRGRFGIMNTQIGMSKPLSASIQMLNYRRNKMAADQRGRARWV